LDVSIVILKPYKTSSSYPNPIPNPVPNPTSNPLTYPTPSSTPNPTQNPDENEIDLSDITIKTNKVLLITFSLMLLFIFH